MTIGCWRKRPCRIGPFVFYTGTTVCYFIRNAEEREIRDFFLDEYEHSERNKAKGKINFIDSRRLMVRVVLRSTGEV